MCRELGPQSCLPRGRRPDVAAVLRHLPGTNAPITPTQNATTLASTSPLDLARSTDTKPDTSYSVDERVGLLIVDLAADAPDIDVDDIGRGLEMQIPYMLQQHCPRNDVALISSQIIENLEFPRLTVRDKRSSLRSPTCNTVSLATVALRRARASTRACLPVSGSSSMSRTQHRLPAITWYSDGSDRTRLNSTIKRSPKN
jgi:hypothetical protein